MALVRKTATTTGFDQWLQIWVHDKTPGDDWVKPNGTPRWTMASGKFDFPGRTTAALSFYDVTDWTEPVPAAAKIESIVASFWRENPASMFEEQVMIEACICNLKHSGGPVPNGNGVTGGIWPIGRSRRSVSLLEDVKESSEEITPSDLLETGFGFYVVLANLSGQLDNDIAIEDPQIDVTFLVDE